jgi:peptidoglycan lytic transglycosylase G
VAQRDRESMIGSDPHGLLFGPDEPEPVFDGRPHPGPQLDRGPDGDDGGRHRSQQRTHNRRFAVLLLVLVLIVAGVSAWAVPKLFGSDNSDYTGAGTGSVVVTVHQGDSLTTIGDTLVRANVVKSIGAFTDAADANSAATNIQPGSYRLTTRIPAKTAVAQLLDPAHRVREADITLPEGGTTLDLEERLVAAPCKNPPPGKVCGLGLDQAAVTKALHDVAGQGLPTNFMNDDNTAPTSLEGFLFPATYNFDRTGTVSDLLQQMVSTFIERARATNFAASAKPLHLSPYQELVVASIAQSEARFPDDFAKVARVILNRIAAHMPLKIDATTRYGAALAGLDPSKVDYAHYATPYNSYLHTGLPPTPISNPGTAAMRGAAHPAKGNWLYYVNGDKAGHLYFTNSDTKFAQAVQRCRTHNWGCG